MVEDENMGVPASPSGHEASPSAADASSQSRVPNAEAKAESTARLGERYRQIQSEQYGCSATVCTFPHDGNCWCFNTALAQHVAQATDALTTEMLRRDNNEGRNCLNWGPCSRNDGRMSEASYASGIEARSDETPAAAQPEGQEPGGEAETP